MVWHKIKTARRVCLANFETSPEGVCICTKQARLSGRVMCRKTLIEYHPIKIEFRRGNDQRIQQGFPFLTFNGGDSQ